MFACVAMKMGAKSEPSIDYYCLRDLRISTDMS